MNAGTTTTHIGRVRAENATSEQKVCKVLGVSYEDYCKFKYVEGVEYLCLAVNNDVEVFRALESSKVYWGWWKNEWAARDEAFIRQIEGDEIRWNAGKLYIKYHSAQVLWTKTTEQGKHLDDSYAGMVGMFHREMRQKLTLKGREKPCLLPKKYV